jgi:PAS domain S-box-containing protein
MHYKEPKLLEDVKAKEQQLVELDELKRKIEDLETEGKLAREKLEQCESMQKAILEAIPEPAWIKDAEGQFLSVNAPWLEYMGLQKKDCIGKTVFDVFSQEVAQKLHEEDLEVITTGRQIRLQEFLKNKQGNTVWFETIKGPLYNKNGDIAGSLGIARNISERKRAEMSPDRICRALRTLVKCNVALVRAENEADLLLNICRIIVENGAYRLAWVGYKEYDAAKTVRPVALTGHEEGYTKELNITWADTERGRGPTGTAIREGSPCLVKDIRNDSCFTPWREEALERGYLSSLSIPIITGSDVLGALNVYASEPDAFDNEEVTLLEQLANDIAYGIMSLRTASEHRCVAEALARSEHILAEAQAITHLGSWEYDLERDEEYWSAEFFRILGLPLQGTGPAHDSMFDYIHPDYRENVLRRLSESLESVRPYDVEYRIIRPDGEERLIHAKGKILEDKDGKKSKFIGTALDITERKMLEEKQQQLVTLVENSSDLIGIATLSGEVTYINRSGLVMAGLENLEAARKTRIIDYITDDDRQAFGEILQETFWSGSWCGEFRLRNLMTGIPFPVEMNCFLITNEQTGAPHAIVTISRDISERKRNEDALRHSEGKFRSLVEATTDWIWEIDENSVYTYVSPKVRDLLGYEPEEVIGKTPFDFIHPEDVKRLEEKLNTIKADRITFSVIETVFMHKDGNLLTAETSGVPVCDAFGGFCGYRGITRDITARKKLEHQCLQAQKMEAVGQLAGGIAHDFNNILTAMVGYLHLLANRIGDEKARHYVDQMTALAEKAAELTESLLMFSRKQEQNFCPEPLDLNKVIERAGKMLKRLIGENIEFQTILHEEALPVLVVANQIEQVLMNLATNARDAMHDGGLLTIRTDVMYIDSYFMRMHGFGEPGKYALLSVSDNGTGMDEKTCKRVFEPFFTTKEVGKGTGLGLSTSYGIINQHNGYINVSSEPGEGTIFRIYLPLLEAGRGEEA